MVEEEGESPQPPSREANYVPIWGMERPCAISTEGYLKDDKKRNAIEDVTFTL